MRTQAGVNGLVVIAALNLTALLSGCVSANVAPTVVSYNLAVERAQNEMLLLNVVRAAKWQPMYLTDVAKITGSIKRDLSATLAIPFGKAAGDPAATYVAGSGATFSVNPTFEINTLNTTDFMKGFLQPVTPERFEYFWNQNWPPEFLLHLFVLQADVLGSDGKITELFNHPRFESKNHNKQLREFSAWVKEFVSWKPHFGNCERMESVGPGVAVDAQKDLFPLLLGIAKEPGLRVDTDPRSWRPINYGGSKGN